MKLATLPNGTRDGRLVVVNRGLRACADASAVAPTVQAALDDWANCASRLTELATALENDTVPTEPFDESAALAPLPRAYQWADASAYLNHVRLVRQARGAELPPELETSPLMYQGGSDHCIAPHGDIEIADEEWGVDFEAEVAVVLDDVPTGTESSAAGSHICLLMLVNDVSLRNLTPGELAKGFGFFQSKPPCAFSPVAVTPDELGEAWDGARVHLPMQVDLNDEPFGRANAGQDMTFDFPTLVAHAARTRPLRAGTILGSGTISNSGADGGPGAPIAAGGVGYSCISELRMVETIQDGAARTPFLRDGDRVSINMVGADGRSIFGTIRQTVVRRAPTT